MWCKALKKIARNSWLGLCQLGEVSTFESGKESSSGTLCDLFIFCIWTQIFTHMLHVFQSREKCRAQSKPSFASPLPNSAACSGTFLWTWGFCSWPLCWPGTRGHLLQPQLLFPTLSEMRPWLSCTRTSWSRWGLLPHLFSCAFIAFNFSLADISDLQIMDCMHPRPALNVAQCL